MQLDNDFVENVRLNSMLNKHLYAVRSKKVKPNTKGAHSYCYYFGNYVILRNINKFSNNEEALVEAEKQFNAKKEFINNIKLKFDVNTPEICCCYKGKYHFYEIQERARGSILSVFYPSTARAISYKTNCVLDGSNTSEELMKEEKVQPFEESVIGHGMYLYNINMQKQLKNTPQKLFDKFVRDFRTLEQNGISIDAYRSENFLFDKETGFSFIDLELKGKHCKAPTDYDIGTKIYSAFADFSTYCRFMTETESKAILKNADTIKHRLYVAMKNNGFSLSKEEDAALQFGANTAKLNAERLATFRK